MNLQRKSTIQLGWIQLRSHFWKIVVTVTLLLIATGVALLLDTKIQKFDGVIFVAILVFPLIGYLVLSDKLSEFSGPGGWSVKFKDVMSAPPKGHTMPQASKHIRFLSKGPVNDLRTHFDASRSNEDSILVIKLGTGIQYEDTAIEAFLCAFLIFNFEPVVVFVNKTGNFVGSISAAQLHALFCDKMRNQFVAAFMEEINSPDPSVLNSVPLVGTKLSKAASTIDALREFRETGANALVVVDNDKRPFSVVFRDRLVTTLLLSMSVGFKSARTNEDDDELGSAGYNG